MSKRSTTHGLKAQSITFKPEKEEELVRKKAMKLRETYTEKTKKFLSL